MSSCISLRARQLVPTAVSNSRSEILEFHGTRESAEKIPLLFSQTTRKLTNCAILVSGILTLAFAEFSISRKRGKNCILYLRLIFSGRIIPWLIPFSDTLYTYGIKKLRETLESFLRYIVSSRLLILSMKNLKKPIKDNCEGTESSWDSYSHNFGTPCTPIRNECRFFKKKKSTYKGNRIGWKSTVFFYVCRPLPNAS